jgi:hypothetical protein
MSMRRDRKSRNKFEGFPRYSQANKRLFSMENLLAVRGNIVEYARITKSEG